MDAEQWTELLKLRDKASLSPKTDDRFQSLEMYLSALHTLSFFSKEEKEKLNAQFNDLSDQDRQDLTHRVKNKTLPDFFHLTHQEKEKLQAARKDLPLHERARLFSNLISTATGTALLDLGEVFEAQIEIDDNSSTERCSRPYAHISFSNGYQRQVETVDILESVKNNPAAIGHPAIVFAIYHWQRVIRAKRVIERADITSRDEIWLSFRQEVSGEREVKVAARNLAAIGKNLLGGAKSEAISKEAAFAIKLELLRLRLEDTNTVLYKAWEKLEAKSIDPTDEIEQVLAKLEACLLAFEQHPHTDTKSRRISADRVIKFLRAEGEKGGKRFVGNNDEGISQRPSWKVFRNAFAACFFDLEQSVVQEYLEKAAKKNVASDDVYQYSLISPKSNVYRVFLYSLSNQLLMARDPVIISEDSIGSEGLESAIAEAISGIAEEDKGN